MNTTTNSLVQKLWNYCNVLRDDGMSYGDYVEQLTYLLFLKMADERTRPPFNLDGRQAGIVPAPWDWPAPAPPTRKTPAPGSIPSPSSVSRRSITP